MMRLIHATTTAILTTCALVAAGVVTLANVDDAEACSPMEEEVRWSIPADGDVVPPDTRVMLITAGYIRSNDYVTLTDAEGEEVEGDEVLERMGQIFSGLREFFPDEPLEEGEYTLVADYDSERRDNYEITFEVEDFEIDDGVGQPVQFEWYYETHDEPKGDTCYMADEIHALAIEPVDGDPDYYEIFFSHGDGSETLYVRNPESVTGGTHIYEVTDVDCITVAPGWIDAGRAVGDLTQYCEPHKCKHYGEDEPYDLGHTEWADVDGCGQEDNGTDEERCSAVGGAAALLCMVVLMALGLLRVRRRAQHVEDKR